MTLLLVACLQAIKGTKVSTKGAKEVVMEMLNRLSWISERPTMTEDLMISSFSTAQLVLCLLNLQNQLRINPDMLRDLAKIIEKTLASGRLDPAQSSVLVNSLLHLVNQPINVMQLLVSSLK